MWPTCPICKQPVDTEHPESVYCRGPVSFREAWFHGFCLELAVEDAQDRPGSTPEYTDRWDEYLSTS